MKKSAKIILPIIGLVAVAATVAILNMVGILHQPYESDIVISPEQQAIYSRAANAKDISVCAEPDILSYAWADCIYATVKTVMDRDTCMQQVPLTYVGKRDPDGLSLMQSVCWRAYAYSSLDPTACDNIPTYGTLCWGEVAAKMSLSDGLRVCDQRPTLRDQENCFGALIQAHDNYRTDPAYQTICNDIGAQRIAESSALKENCRFAKKS